jgi:phage shock protein E
MKTLNRVFGKLHNISALLLASILMLVGPMSLAQDDTGTQAWQKITQGATVIDVRTAQEFASGHLAGATNIPFEEIVEGVKALGLEKDTSIVLYCRSGRRSGVANDALIAQGYSQTVNAGGYQGLVDVQQQTQAKP